MAVLVLTSAALAQLEIGLVAAASANTTTTTVASIVLPRSGAGTTGHRGCAAVWCPKASQQPRLELEGGKVGPTKVVRKRGDGGGHWYFFKIFFLYILTLNPSSPNLLLVPEPSFKITDPRPLFFPHTYR